MKTINDVYPEYMEYLSLNNKITTLEMKKYKFKNYILPYFENFDINKLDRNMYIDFICKVKENNCSANLMEKIHYVCKDFFRYIALSYNVPNITNDIKLNFNDYKISDNQKKGIFSKKEFDKFIRCVDDKVYHALFNVLFYCGLRKGEALALKISDFKNGSLYINKTITKDSFNGKRLILTPKSKSSIRVVKLDLFTRIELKKLIKFYKNNNKDFNENYFLFGGSNPIACTTLERKKNNYCKLAKVKQIRIHDFRHSHASMLYEKNTKIKLIQERLGHSNIDITLNTYVHTNKKQEKRLTRTINLTRF